MRGMHVAPRTLIVCLLCLAGWNKGRAQVRISDFLNERASALRNKIKSAEAEHASAERLGTLWLALGNTYQEEIDFGPAEDAFARALRLLRGGASQALYADALHGMGAVYMATQRPKDAEKFLDKSAGIYVVLHDKRHEASVRVTYAIALVTDRRFHDAGTQVTQALNELLAEASPNAEWLTNAYLVRSYAECAERRCSDALADVDRAMAVTQEKIPGNSVEMVAAWLAKGSAWWKSGDMEDADRAMQEALRIARMRSDVPKAASVGMETGVLRTYDAFLKAAHRKPEAKQVEMELAHLQEQQPMGCNACTVSASAFSPGMLLP